MYWTSTGPLLWVLWGMLAAIAGIGGLVTYRALSAYRSHRSRPLLFLGTGLFLIAVGMPVLWMGAYVLTENLVWCSLIAGGAIFLGFAFILSSVQIRTEHLRGPNTGH